MEDPKRIKDEVISYFSQLYAKDNRERPFIHHLEATESEVLEKVFFEE